MAKLLEILKYPNAILKAKAEKITTITPEIKELAENMLLTMYKNNGIGLAANQVGVLKRIIVVDIAENTPSSNALVLINPSILEKSTEIFEYTEGCLSFPELSAALAKRAKHIVVKYLDLNGTEQTLAAEDLLSVCIQHEIDHLNGILFIDHLSKLKKNILLRKYHRKLATETPS